MKKQVRQQEALVALGAERLAELLLQFSGEYRPLEMRLQRLTATPAENLKQYKSKLAALKRSTRFLDWHEVNGFARELEDLLETLKGSVSNPVVGVESVLSFYECDEAIFARCDDSNGVVGDVFCLTARELFIHYACACADKTWLIERLLTFYGNDHYGVRFALIPKASRYLNAEAMRAWVELLWQKARKEIPQSWEARHWLLPIQELAWELRDAALFEQACREVWGELSTASHLGLAQICLLADQPEQALSWMQRIPAQETFKLHERDETLWEIYQRLGDQPALEATAWRIFRRDRHAESWERLVQVVGESQRPTLLVQQRLEILQQERLSLADVSFLLAVGEVETAEVCLRQHQQELNGEHYTQLVPLAQQLEEHQRWWAASLLYRALLDSILARSQSKYYHHGVRYLKKLDELAPRITVWEPLPSHTVLHTALKQQHGRKVSFWSKYNEI